jgi:hypothetical protein
LIKEEIKKETLRVLETNEKIPKPIRYKQAVLSRAFIAINAYTEKVEKKS